MERYKENLLKMEKKDIFKDQLILLTKNMKRGFKKGNLYLNMENMEHISKLFGVQFDYEPEPLELDEIEESIYIYIFIYIYIYKANSQIYLS